MKIKSFKDFKKLSYAEKVHYLENDIKVFKKYEGEANNKNKAINKAVFSKNRDEYLDAIKSIKMNGYDIA